MPKNIIKINAPFRSLGLYSEPSMIAGSSKKWVQVDVK